MHVRQVLGFKTDSCILIDPSAARNADKIERLWHEGDREGVMRLLVPPGGYLNPQRLSCRLLGCANDMSLLAILAEVSSWGRRPARAYELAAFDLFFPPERYKFEEEIVALGPLRSENPASGQIQGPVPFLVDSTAGNSTKRIRAWMDLKRDTFELVESGSTNRVDLNNLSFLTVAKER